jgi:hypothetical protein
MPLDMTGIRYDSSGNPNRIICDDAHHLQELICWRSGLI